MVNFLCRLESPLCAFYCQFLFIEKLFYLYDGLDILFFVNPLKGDVRAEIAQLFKYKLLFQPFIILDLYLQHME